MIVDSAESWKVDRSTGGIEKASNVTGITVHRGGGGKPPPRWRGYLDGEDGCD